MMKFLKITAPIMSFALMCNGVYDHNISAAFGWGLLCMTEIEIILKYGIDGKE